MPELTKVLTTVAWWPDDAETERDCEEVGGVSVSYEDDTIMVDGLRDGEYLAIPLSAIAGAIAVNAT